MFENLADAGCPLSVLIVDDFHEAADSMASFLAFCGHLVRVTYDAKSALELTAEDPPDAVLSDIRMPQMDGFELATRIAASGRKPLMLAVTGFGDDQVRERCKQAGFDHLLVKPADPQVVLDVLKAHESKLRRTAVE